jgi:hypothetical protein
MRAIYASFFALICAATCSGADLAVDAGAETVYRHGLIYTVDAHDHMAEAIAVRAGRIVFVGSDVDAAHLIDARTHVVDLAGRFVMPGLIDAHMHPLDGGAQLVSCNLDYKPLTIEAFRDRIQACIDADRTHEPDGWLNVTGWYRQFMLPSGTDADARTLSALKTARPILVHSTDGHSVLANERAMSLAHLNSGSKDPPDGRMARASDGSLSGIFEDGAHRPLLERVPVPSETDTEAMARAALRALNAQGVTSFLDAAASSASIAAFSHLAKQRAMTARGHFAPVIDTQEAQQPQVVVARLKALFAKYNQIGTDSVPGIVVRNAKIFMDGVLQAPAQTAGLLEPYLEDRGQAAHPRFAPGSKRGDVYFPPELLTPLLDALARSGIEPHIHAIGDRSVRQALDAIEAMRKSVPNPDLRVAMAHEELVDVQDLPRFAALNVIPVMSFQWAKPGPDSIDAARDYLGAARFAHMEPEGSLNAAHARIAYGSDWPVDRLNEWFALKVGVTRTGDPELGIKYQGQLNQDAVLPRATALRAITMNAAYALHMDSEVGSLETGKLADLIVLDRNPMKVPAEEIAQVRVLLTLLGGKVVYQASSF